MLSLQDVFSKEEIYDDGAQMKEQLNDPEFVVSDRRLTDFDDAAL